MLTYSRVRLGFLLAQKRWALSGGTYEAALQGSRENVYKLLERHDRSSYILSQYIPDPARDAFIAIRAFLFEVNKINDGGSGGNTVSSQASSHLSGTMGLSTADMKFKFWSDNLNKVFVNPESSGNIGEPITMLLRNSLKEDINLDISYFYQVLQTRRHFLQTRSFKTIEDMCSYGEGVHSQLNYATQAALLSPIISPSSIRLLELSEDLQSNVSDIAAHIGQASSISSMILGLPYYSKTKNIITLPIQVMNKHDLSQESVSRALQGHTKDEEELKHVSEKLKNCLFDTTVAANDHIITARTKLQQIKQEIPEIIQQHPEESTILKQKLKWRKNIPDSLFVPMMSALPVSLYLEKLEKYDFDLFNKRLNQQEWRLPWRSFRAYYLRFI